MICQLRGRYFQFVISSNTLFMEVRSQSGDSNSQVSPNTTFAILNPFCWEIFTLIPALISNYIHYKAWDKITYPFPNFGNGCADVTYHFYDIMAGWNYYMIRACDFSCLNLSYRWMCNPFVWHRYCFCYNKVCNNENMHKATTRTRSQRKRRQNNFDR